jgi:hypothetical protein
VRDNEDKLGRYGAAYWRVDFVDGTQVWVSADSVKIDAGALMFIRDRGGKGAINMAVAPGRWLAFYAASIDDGIPIAVEHRRKGDL